MAQIREILYRTIQGDSGRKIGRSLGISRTSVRKYLDIAAKQFGFTVNTPVAAIDQIALQVSDAIYQGKSEHGKIDALLLPYKEFIGELLSQEHMTQTQIQRKLRSIHGCDVHIRALNRFIGKYFAKPIGYTVHLETKPGEEAQVDYADVGMMIGLDGKLRKTYAFIMTVSHSRYRYVEFVQSQSQESWCQSHMNAFAFFGCVPKRILLDNLKAGVIKPDIYDPTLNRAYEELSRFYHFIADPAKVRQPQHKGKVERTVTIVRQQLIAGCNYSDIREANMAAKQWCRNDIAKRICSTTGSTPHDLFYAEDKPAMRALPQKAFDLPTWTQGTVHKDHHITIDKNFYSVPTEHIGKTVSIRIGLRTIEIYYKHRLIKTHVRCTGRGQWITDEGDYPERVHFFISQDKAYCIARADEIGDEVCHLITALLKEASKTALRKAQAILRLVDEYGAKRLNDACLRASVYDNYEFETIKQILAKGLDQKTSRSCASNVIDIHKSAYMRPAEEYRSDMAVHHG